MLEQRDRVHCGLCAVAERDQVIPFSGVRRFDVARGSCCEREHGRVRERGRFWEHNANQRIREKIDGHRDIDGYRQAHLMLLGAHAISASMDSAVRGLILACSIQVEAVGVGPSQLTGVCSPLRIQFFGFLDTSKQHCARMALAFGRELHESLANRFTEQYRVCR